VENLPQLLVNRKSRDHGSRPKLPIAIKYSILGKF